MAAIVGLVAFAVLDSPLGTVALVAGITIEVGELYLWSRFLRRYRIQTGPEGLVGKRGELLETPAPTGRARVHGEIWRVVCAEGEEPPPVGAEIEVRAVEGLTLEVAATGVQLR